MRRPPYAAIVLAVEATPTVYIVALTTVEEARLGVWLDAIDDVEIIAALDLLHVVLRDRRAGYYPADVAPRPRRRLRWKRRAA
jgi:hypothetical protein